jgi:hypothetical protein
VVRGARPPPGPSSYAKARYFDPKLGRFLTQDSFLGTQDNPPSLHRYAYAANRPTVYVDPTGHAYTEAELREFFKQTGRNVGWLNEKANKAAPVATAVAVTAMTAGMAAPVAAAIPGVAAGPTIAASLPAGAMVTGTIAGGAGGGAAAFVAAKGAGASTAEAVEQSKIGTLLGAIAGAVGQFTGVVTEAAAAARATGGQLLARLTGAFVGGGSADVAAQATLVASGNQDNIDVAQALQAAAIATTVSAATADAGSTSLGQIQVPKSGETVATRVGREAHAVGAEWRRASGEFELVNQAISGRGGDSILVPHRVDLRTGQPQAGTYLQEAVPDAVSFRRGLIVDDKPLGRPLAKDRQEIIRAIKAYEAREGSLPDRIAITRYDPKTKEFVRTDLHTADEFLPRPR